MRNVKMLTLLGVLLAGACSVKKNSTSGGNGRPSTPPAGPSWKAVGGAGFTPGTVDGPNLAFNPEGVPYMSYKDSATGIDSDKAFVMRFNGTSWEAVGGAVSDGQVDTPSLAFNGDVPYVAYRDVDNGNGASVKSLNGSAWEAVGDEGFTSSWAFTPHLAINNGVPYVAYENYLDGGKGTVMKFDGTPPAWAAVGGSFFTTKAAYTPNLAFNGGMPYVAYRDGDKNDKATVIMYTGTAWVLVGTAGFSAGVANGVKLVFNNGVPYVAYRDGGNNGKATVMKFTGITPERPTGWEPVGTAGFSAGGASPSLAFNGDMPYVAYADGGNNGKATLMRFTEGAWEEVGPAGGFSAGAAESISLAFYNGVPYVTYKDVANLDKATVMKFE